MAFHCSGRTPTAYDATLERRVAYRPPPLPAAVVPLRVQEAAGRSAKEAWPS
jgi:hypothetical protein